MFITNISEAKAQLSALVEKVMAGQEVVIGKAGKPVAKLVRYEQSEKPRRPGALRARNGGRCHYSTILDKSHIFSIVNKIYDLHCKINSPIPNLQIFISEFHLSHRVLFSFQLSAYPFQLLCFEHSAYTLSAPTLTHSLLSSCLE